MILENILHSIGKTPIVKLDKLGNDLNCNLYGKCEFVNPGGSIKDRIGYNMILEAEKKRMLQEINEEIEIVEKEINDLKQKAPVKINIIAMETSIDLLKQVIGVEVNKSSVSAIVEDLSKKNKEKYYGV